MEQLSSNNPLKILIGKGIESFEDYTKFHNIKYTSEQYQEFHRMYDQCNNCLHWYKHNEFSSFSLGCVLCNKCDY